MSLNTAPPQFFCASKKFQYFAAAAATLGAFGLGTCLGWSSPALPALNDTQRFENLTTGQKSWISAILTLGALISGPVAGFLICRIGRKRTMLLAAAPFVLGWLLIAFAQNFVMMLVGRFTTGFCGGSFSLSAPLYIGEMSETRIRGTLGSGFQLMAVTGILFVYCVGALVNLMWLSIICGCIPVAFALLMLFMPESPRHLIAVGKHTEAAEALAWFRGANNASQVADELAFIENSIAEQQRNRATFKDLFRRRSLLHPTLISLGVMAFQQLSGVNVVIFYVETVFQDASVGVQPELASIIVGIVMVLATIVSMFLVEKLGRKLLLIVSAAFMGISLVALGIFFLLKYNEEEQLNPSSSLTIAFTELDVAKLSWLPLVSVIVFITAFSLGFGPIPWMLLGEILPSNGIGLASSISMSFNWFLAFLVTMFFEDLRDALTLHGSLFGFAILCGIGVLYVLFIVPETKGKSLEEIQAMFVSGDTLRNNAKSSQGGRFV